ncbi:MAG: thymidine phosphorylase [Gemmataceae bacterium]|nr:thymidine phosphorylase [Gemmataceae bacterium]MDW8243399.1 thymidine phosphorylase [Thermogemmata sp.]
MSIPLRAVDVIRRKRDGGVLSAQEIDFFVQGASSGTGWTDYQLSALLMAIFLRGMSEEETIRLTQAMAASGTRLEWSDLPGPVVDKHSTGGVGDKTSLILAPLAAACGVYVPMMSGRGLGHTGGTLDKLESIPGFQVCWEIDAIRQLVRNNRLAMVGPTPAMVPADRTLYALRDVTATVESLPLITASILSKKLAEGIQGLVLDVKCGQGAFMKTRVEAEALARSLRDVGTAAGLRLAVLLTAMDAPLGRCIGNALEVREAIATLRGEGPEDITELSLHLAAWMLVLGGITASVDAARHWVERALRSGEGLEVFRRCVAAQGGDPRVVDDPSHLPQAPHITTLQADRPGIVAALDAELIGLATMRLGAGRAHKDEAIDHAVGVVCRVHPGEKVTPGQALLEVHYRDANRLYAAWPLLQQAVVLSEYPPPSLPNQPLLLATWS